MLNINRKLSKQGFSLIELMVAVAILAIAIFGIFHAYSVGFMGMADARAVTVATNYAREAMEDIKNMDFDEIPTPEIVSGSVTVNGIIYNRQVIVQENPNIKRVITTVTWKDRNDKQKMVETDMVIHFIETTADVATRIILYADPYNILLNGGESKLTAVVKDAKGNTVIDWDKGITFLLTEIDGGADLSPDTITIDPDNFIEGKAITIFTSVGNTGGEVTITASSEGLTPDSVTIKVYDPGVPVKINLTASPMFLTPDPGSESEITATIVDAGGDIVEITELITFSVSEPGTLSELTSTTNAGIAIITLTLTPDSPLGTITITASAAGLEPGIVDVITGGQISLSASSIMVPVNEISIITVTTKDVEGVSIKYRGNILLSIGDGSTGTGDLPSEPVYFDGSSTSMTVNFTAGNTPDTIVNIDAVDQAGILDPADPLTLNIIEALVPHHIIVYGMPLSIPVGGTETSLITAKVMTEDNVKVTSYTNNITFTTTAGSFSFDEDVKSITLINDNGNYNDGVATAELYSSDSPEIAEITVSSTVLEVPERIITGSTEVGFYIGPDHIILSAVPQNISVGGQTCIVTVKIVDYGETVISDYNEDIGFSISPCPGTIKFLKATTAFLTQKFKKGITTVILKSGDEPGTAVIVAYSGDLFASLNIPVGISLILADIPNIIYFDSEPFYVSFDIEVQVAEFLLEQMKVSWTPFSEIENELLDKISIFSKGGSSEVTIIFNASEPEVGSITYTNEPIDDPNKRIADIEVASGTTLLTGEYTIKMYFSIDMSVKDILDVIFIPNSGDYTVNLMP